jgi:hypothetical protein
MSLFANSIGGKTNFVRTDEVNVIISETTFEGQVIFTDGVSGLDISDISGVQVELDNLQTNIDVVQLNLDNETTDRANADNNLSNELQLETINRTNADTDLQTNIDAVQTSISNIDNTSDADKPVSTATQTALNLKADQTSISNIDNTSDANKPVSNATQTAIDLKSNIASPSFTGTSTFTKADNYGQIELTDTKPVGAGVGGGITLNGIYGGSNQITAFANIKSKKSNATIGNYSGDLSLSVRQNGGGGYTEVIKLKGEDLKTIVSGSMEVDGNINLTTGSEFQINGVPIGGGGGGGSDIIKERFSRYTLGQTVSTSRGDITLPNVNAELTNTGSSLSWIELTGSNINYTPPANSSVVEYELTFYVYSSGTQNSGIGLQFYIDNVPQTITRAKQPLNEGGTSTWGQMRYSFKTTIEINGTTDATKCFVNTWNTSKNLKLRVSKLQSATMSFHRVTTLFTDNPVQNTDTIIAPLLTITAY